MPWVTPLLVRLWEAPAVLSMSDSQFERYVLPEIEVIAMDGETLVPVAELQRWVSEHTEAPPSSVLG